MTARGPAMNPPSEAKDLEKVPITRSTWSSTPSISDAPAPRVPSTPNPCASSTRSRAWCFFATFTISFRGAMSPSML